jgi:hypothetical protein
MFDFLWKKKDDTEIRDRVANCETHIKRLYSLIHRKPEDGSTEDRIVDRDDVLREARVRGKRGG